MDSAVIVIREVQRDSGSQVPPLLRKGICEPRESTNLHSHGEVLALDM